MLVDHSVQGTLLLRLLVIFRDQLWLLFMIPNNELKSTLISRYIDGVTLAHEWQEPRGYLRMPEELEREVHMLKQLVWVYVIRHPALGTQQMGQVRIIRTLFRTFERCSRSPDDWTEFPERFQERLAKERVGGRVSKDDRLRIVADFVASMTEHQALSMYQRVIGTSQGSALDSLT